ncbi:sugar kinase [Robertkochia solimangrovi]|uniref:sugar kinase n=1 Tax=Robertkochia solimangrovi TaxID=2213046 RepID=UPI00117D81C8|nr:sugar kinase [Robertkochia solimangrovi]TRZ46201.1 sugar kinase [Robertkochia solimangrovi]
MKKVVALGEVLLRLSTKDFLKFAQAGEFNADFGGSEFNVVASAANFGMKAGFVTRLPDNDIGKCALMEMNRFNVDTDNVVFGGDRMGIYFLEKGASIRGSKIIYDRKNSGFASLEKGMIDWEKTFEGATWFHWSGITPGVSQGAADVCLEGLKAAREMGLTISTDFNYRANLWNYGKSPSEIMEEMVGLCDVVLAGDYAASQYFGIEVSGKDEGERQMSLCDQLRKRFPALKSIAITTRGNISALHNTWSAVIDVEGMRYASSTYDITHIVDRIGAGDSFMGALIYGLNHFDPQKAIEFAVAASTLKHTIYGDVNLVTHQEVEALMGGDTSGRVNR